MILKPRPFRKPNLVHPLAKGLVDYWPMLENGGLITQDASLNGNNGILNAGVLWAAGQYGPVLRMDGNTGIVALGTAAAKPTLDVDYCTIVTSVKINHDLTGWCPLYGNGYASGLWLAISSAEALSLYHTSEGNAFDSFISGAILTVGVRYQVVATYDGANKNIYVNGFYAAGEGTGAKSGPLDWSTGVINIGASGGYTTHYDIDYTMLYNRALTAREIEDLYNLQFGLFQPTFSVWWYSGIGGEPPATAGQVIMISN